jgi:hypothetical protein
MLRMVVPRPAWLQSAESPQDSPRTPPLTNHSQRCFRRWEAVFTVCQRCSTVHAYSGLK